MFRTNDYFRHTSVGSSLTLAFALSAATHGDIPENILADIRRRHGSIDEQLGNIDNLVGAVESGTEKWM
ncbi:MAG: hypothetical protein LBH60_08910 [Prevotellaceae bacterium]|nr:hypothetical protein [Prevotellaceae bacterium]